MRVVVSSLGMISPVGLGVVPSAAAVRADVAAPSEIEHHQVLGDDAEAVPIRGHAIREYTDGFQLLGRWLRIASGAVEDLIAYGELPDGRDAAFWRGAGLALATPVIDTDRFQLAAPWPARELCDTYGLRLAGLAGLPIPPDQIDVAPLGHAATAAAMQRAVRALQERRLARAVVIGVDSYVDPLTLEWLADQERLRVGDNPVGLHPGEAGACFLLEPEGDARHRGAAIQAVVGAIAVGEEPRHLFSGEVNHGAGLAAVVGAVLPADAAFTGDVFADLNGEEWRARELAGARLRLGERLAPARILTPASSLGDTGAASGAAAVCLAARAFVRGYDRSGQALVVSSAEHGHVAAMRLAKA